MNAHRQELATLASVTRFANIAVDALATNSTREHDKAQHVARTVWWSCSETTRLLLTQVWTPDIGSALELLAATADLARDMMH